MSSGVPYSERLAQFARERASAVAVIEQVGTSWREYTWSQLDRDVRTVASTLRTDGIGPGDIVSHRLGNTYSALVLNFGAIHVGGCPLPLHPNSGTFEGLPIETHAIYEIDRRLNRGSGHRVSAHPAPPNRKAIASSGTTGDPKVIISNRPAVTHESKDAIEGTVYGALGATSDMRQIVVAPMSHNMAFDMSTMGLIAGHTIMLPSVRNPLHIFDLISRFRAEWIGMPPYYMEIMAPSLEMRRSSLVSLRAIQHSGASCSIELRRQWVTALGADRVYESYGLAEDYGRTTIAATDAKYLRGSAGKPWGCDVGIATHKSDAILTSGVGVIAFRDRAASTPATVVGGSPPRLIDAFTLTEDVGRVDPAGYVYVEGRGTDSAQVYGESVSLSRVESALRSHPDIKEAVVVVAGSILHGLYVRAGETAPAHLREYLLTKLRAVEVPLTLIEIDSVPRNANLKVDRIAARTLI